MDVSSDLSLFPVSTTINSRGNLSIAGCDLAELAAQYGTPLYLYDGTTIRRQLDRLNDLLKRFYAGETAIAYASKAYFSRLFAGKLATIGLGADVVSLGELNVARCSGFPASGVHLHGNNKSEEEMRAALDWNIQAIVVDSLDELAFLEKLAAERSRPARIWLRITPDLTVDTHRHVETSHPESKFGLHIQNGDAAEAIRRAAASPWLKLTGLHTHLGSQIKDAEPYRQAVASLIETAAACHFVPEEISPGGGWGVRYTNTDPPDDAETWVRTVAETVQDGFSEHGWHLPRLVLEPGRWLVAKAGVAVYSVGSQKTTPGGTRITAVDGGMADNIRVALYDARYTARPVKHDSASPSVKTTVVGKYCESSDILISEIMLPAMERGGLLAVPVSGAYHLSMASNYNYAARPVVLWLDEGSVEVLQAREKTETLGWLEHTK